jgi:uncharacterized repeat protein (TIGR01451 family)
VSNIKTRGLLYFAAVLLVMAWLIQMAIPVNATQGTIPETNRVSVLSTNTPSMQFTMTARQAQDVDGDKAISPGDIIQYIVTIRNNGSGTATGVYFYDTPDSNTTLVVKSVIKSQGSVLKGNVTGDKAVVVNIGTIAVSAVVTITFNVTIKAPLWVGQIVNQATLHGTNFSSLKSDNPNTSQSNDPTIVQIKTSPPAHGPGVSQSGVVVMVVLFGGIMAGLLRRKQIQSRLN